MAENIDEDVEILEGFIKNFNDVQEKYKDDEIQAHLRIYKQYQEGAWNRSQVRTKEWNDVSHTDNNTDEHNIRHSHDGQSDVTQNTDNDRINNLAN